MKKVLTIAAMFAVFTMVAETANAQTYSNTYYGQEGTDKDGYSPLNAKEHAPAGTIAELSTSNWKAQWGSSSYAAIYSWDGDAWLETQNEGDGSIDIEVDIEMFWSETIANNKIYFHIGNPFTATAADKQAVVDGTYACNHPCYIGISFDGTSKDDSSFDLATGTVLGGMVGTTDIGGRDVSTNSFDVSFLCKTSNNGAYVPPTSFGAGSHDTQQSVLWWSPTATGITEGTGTFRYLVQIHPDAGQADGNYHLDPIIVKAPAL